MYQKLLGKERCFILHSHFLKHGCILKLGVGSYFEKEGTKNWQSKISGTLNIIFFFFISFFQFVIFQW